MLADVPKGLSFLPVLLAVLLTLSFIISGSEVALFSLTARDLNMLKTKQHPTAKKILGLLEESKQVYTSLLISGTFINICIIVLSNFLMTQYIDFPRLLAGLGEWVPYVELLIKVFVIGFGLIFLAKILPKITATQNNIRFAYGAAFVVEAVHLVFRRLSTWMVRLADNMGRGMGANRSKMAALQKLDQAIDITADEEATVEEKNILKGIVKFGHITVKQIMKSRLEVSGVELNTPFSVMVKRIEELHYSRLPVYRTNLDEVVGVLNTKDVLPHIHDGDNYDWHELMRQPYFVPETKLIEDLLREFQSKKIHFAVVVDEFGGTSGIVTLEDILEEVIGDIRDEFDDEEAVFEKLDENNYVFEGKTKIAEVCRTMALPIDIFDKVKGESESLAGLVLELAGELPSVNDVINSGDFEFTVLEAFKNRLLKVKITIRNREEQK